MAIRPLQVIPSTNRTWLDPTTTGISQTLPSGPAGDRTPSSTTILSNDGRKDITPIFIESFHVPHNTETVAYVSVTCSCHHVAIIKWVTVDYLGSEEMNLETGVYTSVLGSDKMNVAKLNGRDGGLPFQKTGRWTVNFVKPLGIKVPVKWSDIAVFVEVDFPVVGRIEIAAVPLVFLVSN